MRRVVRPRVVWPLALAALLSVGASIGVQEAGGLVEGVVLYVLLTLAFFVVINLLRAFVLSRARPWAPPGAGRGRMGGRWDPSGRGNGWDTSGTREPRRPRRPPLPSRAEALDPDSAVPGA
jgi:hypothetical protein